MTLIFDIGKTNKKVFLFDAGYKIVYEETQRFSEIKDEDGDPCDDLDALIQWIYATLRKLLANKEYKINNINFSSFGASLVHVDATGTPFLPLYSYLKPLSPSLKKQFFDTYGGEELISRQTASPVLDSLNSGLQLYRLKYEKCIHEKPGFSLHVPQFLSSLITGKFYSDITSIGCHTMLWDFCKKDYHQWVYKESLSNRLAPIFSSAKLVDVKPEFGGLKSGIGLHDSSSAIIPYLATFKEPFALISTGTWSISLNPFNKQPLTDDELKQDCLSFLSYKGNPVKASRLFAGNEHEQQEKKITAHFNKSNQYFNTLRFDEQLTKQILNNYGQDNRDRFEQGHSFFERRDISSYSSYEQAYHQLVIDIVRQQVLSTNLILNGSDVRNIYVDGGFSHNDVYMHLLSAAYADYNVYAASVAQASATGAALAIAAENVPADLVSVVSY